MPHKPADKNLSRRERELAFRVDLVLDAALEVFANSSFANASVEEIASRAEISVGTLYNLFRSKEDVYRAVVSRAQRMMFDTAERSISEARGLREQLHACIGSVLEHFGRYTDHMKLYVSASNGFQWELKSKLADEALVQQNRFRARVAEICQKGMDEGIFKTGIPADLLAISLVSIPHAFLTGVLEDDSNDADLVSLIPQALALVDRMIGTDNA